MSSIPRLPPVALMMIVGLLMWAANRLLPQLSFHRPLLVQGALLLVLLGIGVCVAAFGQFRRAGTSVDPLHPQQASQLLSTGVFQCSRNPMYVGFVLVLLAWALLAQNFAALALVPLFVLYMDRVQIPAEEAALRMSFGGEYEVYVSKVRRWI